MKTAWMVRNDGKAFGIDWHIYGNEEDIFQGNGRSKIDFQETLDAAIWLYKHTTKEKTKTLCLNFIYIWMNQYYMPVKCKHKVNYILELVKERQIYNGTTDWHFLEVHREAIERLDDYFQTYTLEDVSKLVCYELDQEFLRVRYGGMYDTEFGNRDMYFRVSSSGFDWMQIIKVMVERFQPDTVTVCRDSESTNYEGFLFVEENRNCDHLSLTDFLNIKEYASLVSELNQGGSLLETYPYQNKQRLFMQYEQVRKRENEMYQKNTELLKK